MKDTFLNESYAEYISKHIDNKSIKELAETLCISCTEVRAIYEAHFNEFEKSDIEKAKNQHFCSKAKPVVGFPLEGGEPICFESAYAAKLQGFFTAGIRACIKGKIKQHKGYVWRYAEEETHDKD